MSYDKAKYREKQSCYYYQNTYGDAKERNMVKPLITGTTTPLKANSDVTQLVIGLAFLLIQMPRLNLCINL